jgi:hypothetical protein
MMTSYRFPREHWRENSQIADSGSKGSLALLQNSDQGHVFRPSFYTSMNPYRPGHAEVGHAIQRSTLHMASVR